MARNRFLDATSVLDAFGRPSLAGFANLEKAKRVAMRRADLLIG